MDIKITKCLFNGLKSSIEDSPKTPILSTNFKNPQDILSDMECLSLGKRANIHSYKNKMPLLFFSESIPLRKTYKEVDKLISKLNPQEKISGCNTGIVSPEFIYTPFPNCTYQINHFIHSNKGYTSDLDDCLAIIIHNAVDSYMFHLSPNCHKEQKAINAMQLRLSNLINELQRERENNKCKAWLIGGCECEGSHKLHQNISYVLNDKGVITQEILFSEGLKDVYYDINKGIILRHGTYSSLSELKNDFSHVILN